MAGRESKYRKSIVDRICELIRSDTYTIAEICQNVSISRETFYKWERQYIDFSDAIKKAKDDRDLKFAAAARNSLLQKLTGYTYEETKVVYVTKKGIKAEAEEVKTTKHVPPDTVAIIFTLCNKDGWTNRYISAQQKENERDTCILDELKNGNNKD
jgi:transposase-like protein